LIKEYFRPESIEDAIRLLQSKETKTVPLAGGTVLSHYQRDSISVVDLQKLNLNYLLNNVDSYEIGATTTLSQIEENIQFPELVEVIRLQAGKNKRNSSTIGGLISMADGRSPLVSALLALNPKMIWEPGDLSVSLEDWLTKRSDWKDAVLIKKLVLPKAQFLFESVARSPKDLPILCIAISKDHLEKMRIVIGGFGDAPILAFSGNDLRGIENKIDKTLAGSADKWASSEYRQKAAKALVMRMVSELSEMRAK
jgi:CO/xanthine dehydrogenase FAD-binding subunit